MAAITDVTLTSGVGTGGTGTVSTLDKFNGTAGASTAQALTVQGIASGTALPVSIASVPSHAVTNAGTFAVQAAATLAAETTKVIGTVNVAAAQTIATTNAGTFAVQIDAGAVTSLALIDDTITAQGTALGSTKTTLLGGSVTTAAPTYTTGQISPLNLDTTGALRVNVTAGGAGGGIVTQATAANLNTTAQITDGTNIATVKAVSTAPVTATDKALVVAMRPDSPGIIATGTQASPSASYLSTVAAGDIAAAATDSGNPQKIGGVGKTANPTAVTDGQRVNAIFDKLGKQIVVGAIRDLKGMQQTSISNSTSETTIVTAVASTFLDLYGLILANTGATTTKVSIRDDTAGTVRAIIEVPTLETRGFMLPVDSGLPQTAVNKNWTATCASATTALEVTALYVKNL